MVNLTSENLRALMAEIGQAIEETAEQLESHQAREFTGTAADGLVTVRLADGQLEIDIHVLAKRRLERTDLAEAVVAAINEAESQATEAVLPTTLQQRADSAVSDLFHTQFRQAMQDFRRFMP